MRKKAKTKCVPLDYALAESARQQIREPNKFICTCCHCRAQAIYKEDVKHTPDCCFKHIFKQLSH